MELFRVDCRNSFSKRCSVLFIALACSFIGNNAFADLNSLIGNKEVKVVHVTSDVVQGSMDMMLYVNSKLNIVGLRRYLSDGTMVEINPADLKAGLVLYRMNNKDVLTIVSTDFNPITGGSFELVYLSYLPTNAYEKYPMELVRVGDRWTFTTNDQSGRKEFSNMIILGRIENGQPVGVRDIKTW